MAVNEMILANFKAFVDRTGRGMKGFDSFTRLRTSIFALPAGDAMGVPSCDSQ